MRVQRSEERLDAYTHGRYRALYSSRADISSSAYCAEYPAGYRYTRYNTAHNGCVYLEYHGRDPQPYITELYVQAGPPPPLLACLPAISSSFPTS